jgi:alpha-tubulin suppressor-like RCC1 family protein
MFTALLREISIRCIKKRWTVWTWGYNESGQLGDGPTENRFEPVKVNGLTDIVAVDAGGNKTVALKKDGTVWMCGYR